MFKKLTVLSLGLQLLFVQSAYAISQNNGFIEFKPYFSPITEINKAKIVLVLKERKLYLYEDNKISKVFSVAIGKSGWRTPTGNFKIIDKIMNPAWTNFKTGKIVKPGKNNPLGSRWLEFYKVPNTPDSIGFHGTSDLNSIGKDASHGCVRMYPKDVEFLYDFVDIGTSVKVI